MFDSHTCFLMILSFTQSELRVEIFRFKLVSASRRTFSKHFVWSKLLAQVHWRIDNGDPNQCTEVKIIPQLSEFHISILVQSSQNRGGSRLNKLPIWWLNPNLPGPSIACASPWISARSGSNLISWSLCHPQPTANCYYYYYNTNKFSDDNIFLNSRNNKNKYEERLFINYSS